MQIYRAEMTISNDGTLTLKGVPFHAGDKVEVIVRSCQRRREPNGRYPLRGKAIRYTDPFGSVAEDDWETLK